jgi:hypothetical protein
MFKRSLRGKVTLNLTEDERKMLFDLYHQMHELLETPDVPESSDPLAVLVGLDGPTQAPSDPAVARLFPTAYLDDAAAAADFRRFTEPDLRNEKLTNLEMVSDLLDGQTDKLELNQDQVNAWLRSLNDLRLVLGTRIGVGEDYEEQAQDDPGFHLYDYLTYLQGTLIDAL